MPTTTTTTTTSSSSSSSWSSHPITRSRPDSTRKVDDAMKASNGSSVVDATNNNKEKAAAYRECRKNHAASIGGYAVDGCREFMASGAEGTAAALRCAACGCHRSFHRREVVVVLAAAAAAAEPHASSDCSSNSNS